MHEDYGLILIVGIEREVADCLVALGGFLDAERNAADLIPLAVEKGDRGDSPSLPLLSFHDHLPVNGCHRGSLRVGQHDGE